MPNIQIKAGDTLSKLAATHGTSVAEIIASNKDNPSVKSANLIIAGGVLNLPERVSAPAAGPTTETPAESLTPKGSSLGNLRIALRAAAEEAGKERVASRLEQFQGAGLGRTPGTLGSIADIVRGSVKPGVEQTFSDVMKSYQEEQERLRQEGRAPEVIGSAETGYYQWDKDSRAWQPISNVAAGSFDSGLSDDSWVKLIMAGQANITNVKNSGQQNRVAVLLADELPDPTNKAWAKKQYDEGKAINLTDDQIRKDMVKAGVPESIINEVIPAAPKGTPLLERLGGALGLKKPETSTASPFGTSNFADIHIDDRITQLKQTLGTGASGATNTYLEKQLLQNGYHPDQIKIRTRTGAFDFLK